MVHTSSAGSIIRLLQAVIQRLDTGLQELFPLLPFSFLCRKDLKLQGKAMSD